MPKETVSSKYDGTLESTYFHVGWTKSGDHVELSVMNRLVESKFPGDTSHGWFVQLDRDGCNRAIKALRKARDEAFGKDQ